MTPRDVLVLVMVTGCGRIAFDEGSPVGDGSVDAVPLISGRHWVNRLDATPGALLEPRLAFVPGHGVVLYGGSIDSEMGSFPTMVTAAMWQLGAAGWTKICDPCAPGRRRAHALAYDARRQRLVLQGGVDETGTLHADTWEWDGSSWAQVNPSGPAPTARGAAAMVYDARRERIVLFGGYISTTVITADVYEYDGTAWTHPQPTGGPAAIDAGGQGATYDAVMQRPVVLADAGPLVAGRDEAWTWDGTAWTELCSGCTGQRRTAASLAFDPATRSSYLVAGYETVSQSSLSGTWQSSAGTWPEVSALPDRRDSSGFAYDAARNVLVLYGGNGEGCASNVYSNCAETFELVPD